MTLHDPALQNLKTEVAMLIHDLALLGFGQHSSNIDRERTIQMLQFHYYKLCRVAEENGIAAVVEA